MCNTDVCLQRLWESAGLFYFDEMGERGPWGLGHSKWCHLVWFQGLIDS